MPVCVSYSLSNVRNLKDRFLLRNVIICEQVKLMLGSHKKAVMSVQCADCRVLFRPEYFSNQFHSSTVNENIGMFQISSNLEVKNCIDDTTLGRRNVSAGLALFI